MATKTNRVDDTMTAFTEAMIGALESGIADPHGWRAPWHDRSFLGGRTNALTGQKYTGGNAWTLAFREAQGAEPFWATYRQWETLGAQVRKGEHADYLLRVIVPPRKDDGNDKAPTPPADGGQEPGKRRFFLRAFAVFHSGQVDGWESPAPEVTVTDGARRPDADAAIAAWGEQSNVDWVPDDEAYYAPGSDTLHLPTFESYVEADGYYSTVFHEYTHWTGHHSRLDRNLNAIPHDRAARAAEELVAELGSAVLGAEYGISGELRADHRDYLAGWLTALRNDPKHLWHAAGKASRAATHLLELAGVPLDDPVGVAA